MNHTVWYPYQQMKNYNAPHEVVRAEKEFLFLRNDKCLIDGISSWWAAIHGYNDPELNEALLSQVSQFSHVMLGGLTHKPVQMLADKLVAITPEGLNHVFFSDSGSVAVEVALKMAIQYWSNQGSSEKHRFISLKNAYHGDTFKTMEVGDDSDYQQAYQHVLTKGFYVDIPKGGLEADTSSVMLALGELQSLLEQHAQEIAAMIVEPVVQCAGGFRIYSPEYLQKARDLCKKYEVLFICDEVATGFGRTGKMTASEHAQIAPDIMVLGKALTAGYLGHAATIASSKVFEQFLGDTRESAFMHGPTFMGNPLACAVALKGIELFEKRNYLEKIQSIESTFNKSFENYSHFCIKEIRVFGAMAVVEVKDKKYLDGFQQFAYDKGVWLRPIGKCLYTTPPYIISTASLEKIIDTIKEWFNQR